MNACANDAAHAHKAHLSVALVALQGFDFQCFSSTLDMASTANKKYGRELISTTIIGIDSLITSSLGITITPNFELTHTTLTDFDAVIVLGGADTQLVAHSALTTQLLQADAAGKILGGVWNGTYHLAAAGLTKGYECIIAADGRFTIEPSSEGRTRLHWQFDGRRMSTSHCYGVPSMMTALFRHFVNDAALRSLEPDAPL